MFYQDFIIKKRFIYNWNYYNVDENKQIIRYDSTDKSLTRNIFEEKAKEYMEN